jgi:hypothetical protein
LKRAKDYERQEREAYERNLTQSNMGLRSWAARQAAQTPEQREAERARQREVAAESRRLAEESYRGDNGKVIYAPIIEFTDSSTRNAFSERAIAALLEYAPAAFDDQTAA